MVKGSCHCGAVKYEVGGKLLKFAYCHCPDCQKFTGSAFNPALIAESDGFVVTQGEDNLVAHESSPGKLRHFCKTCGCHLFGTSKNREGMVIVLAGTLDTDPGMKPQCHIWVSKKPAWHEIGDSLPQFPEWPPQ